MRRVPFVAMLLVLLGLAVPSRATTGEGIVLQGSRTAWVDLYVYVNTTIDTSAMQLATKGSYVGFYMSPAPADRDTVGALVMPRVGATGETSSDVIRLGDSWDVAAGRYRVYLITDGLSRVFIPIEGQGYRAWAPRNLAPLSVRPASFDVAPGTPGDTKRVPVALKQRSLVVAVGVASSASLTAVDMLTACVTTDAGCDTTYELAARVPAARAWTYGAALVPPGAYGAQLELHRLFGDDAGSHVDAAVLVLTIGIQT